jgi:uncharacterized protein YgfB (UPF0149 family)
VIAFEIAHRERTIYDVTAPIVPQYAALRESLSHVGAVVAVPELHGGICGALCAGGPVAAERWLDETLTDDSPEVDAAIATDPSREPLHELVRASWQALHEAELEFEPVLPDDDAPLEEQVAALGAWCQGFLAALGRSAPDLGRATEGKPRAEPDAIEEIIADFVEISRAGITDEDAADPTQAEFALAEVKEYVRVSVQIVFGELTASRGAAGRGVH